ncbi:hypothetical protein SAMN05216603_12911 [Pseudomonas benzenivorans]|nr:hypothetical protein [Pseudomonas benzenivorans]SDI25502.1 hypothetical protein SAMN05216603_12911 [Pseudomonas benzenivorans]
MDTLLTIVEDYYGLAVDPDSDGGQILASLRPKPPFVGADLSGEADVSSLTLSPKPGGGVTVRAAVPGDALVLGVPAGDVDFSIEPVAGGSVAVGVTLVAPKLRIPGLLPARPVDAETLEVLPGVDGVCLVLPRLLLLVTARPGVPDAEASLAPSHDAAGAVEAVMEPPHAFVGPSAVLGLHMRRATLNLDDPAGAALAFPEVEVFVAPPGMPALAARGSGAGLKLDFRPDGGLSGDVSVAAVGDPARRPRFLKNVAIRVRLNRSSLVLAEVRGDVALGAEITALLGTPLDEGPETIRYRLSLALADGWNPADQDAWRAALELTAAGGGGFLWRSVRGEPHSRNLPRDTLGAYAVFTPLLQPALPGAGSSGYVDLWTSAALAGALAGSAWITTQQVTLYGGRLVAAKKVLGETEGLLFFDLETEFSIDVHVGGASLIKSRHPFRVRQKSVGLRLAFGGVSPGLKPVFDPMQGFNLDLSDPGSFDIPAPLGNFLQPDTPRMARENPLNLEIVLRPKADLGIVTIDRASVRVPLDGGGVPTLTALDAHLNVGLLQGSGSLELLPNGFKGTFDASFGAPLDIRAAAVLELEDAGGPVSVRLGFDVEWPVPIPLANSGIGLFGILGVLAVRRRRDVGPGKTALDWYVEADGNPIGGKWATDPEGWALGIGAVLGTLEGGTLVNTKGLLMLELPGPRFLLIMKADILTRRPKRQGRDLGRLLAVMEISQKSLMIGIAAEYRVPFLIEVRVPAEAYFDFDNTSDWRLDVGKLGGLMASVRFMSSIRADGYLMIHGSDITGFPPKPLPGPAVATGVRAALTWGPQDIGLYIKVAASADVGISFKPPLLTGTLRLDGELHLFIVSVGVSAKGDFTIMDNDFYVRAHVEGRVRFFWFEVKGGVTLELGNAAIGRPEAEPMIRALSLHARSRALLPGSGTSGPIDGSFGDAASDGGAGPTVPIDAIPVLQFEMRPFVEDGCTFGGEPIRPQLAPKAWARRGQRLIRYRVKSIAVSATDAAGTPHAAPFDAGEQPHVWWTRSAGTNGQGTRQDEGAQLALLNWTPDPTPTAALRTIQRTLTVKRNWGDVCTPVARPAAVLWTFGGKSPGPSATGWTLEGTAWSDKPATLRSVSARTGMTVTEPWRSGSPLADALVDVDPGLVLAGTDPMQCMLVAPLTTPELRPRVPGDPDFDALAAAFGLSRLETLPDAIRLDTDGIRRLRALVFVVRETGRIVLRARGAAGEDLGFEVSVEDFGGEIGAFADLPEEWRDPGGPWLDEVAALFSAGMPTLMTRLSALVLFEVDLPEATATVDLGMVDNPADRPGRWGLLVAEGTTEAEFRRHSFDETTQSEKRKVVDGALGADESERALLKPNSAYAVAVTYAVDTADADPNGNAVPGTEMEGKVDVTRTFRFRTDAAPPSRLEPSVLATSPAEGEDAVFYAEPIRLVFASQAVRRLYRAYGAELYASVKAASGNHPRGNAFDPALLEFSLSAAGPLAVPAQTVTPFGAMLAEAITDPDAAGGPKLLDCLPFAMVVTDPHELVAIDFELEPVTGYVMDLVIRDGAGQRMFDEPSHPSLRRSFTTSRYRSHEAFAADVRQTAVRHAFMADPAALAVLGQDGAAGTVAPVADLDFETALRTAGWTDLTRPTRPRVTVIWTGGGADPQPFGVMVEATEPFWRSRGLPEEVTADDVKSYRLVPRPWLELREDSAAPVAARILRSTGGARVLAVLAPGARGRQLRLALRRIHHPLFEGNVDQVDATAVDVALDAAPWEDR